MPKYPVLEPLEFDQKRFAPGSTVELTEDQARPLLTVKVIGDPVDDGNSPARKTGLDAIDKRRKLSEEK